MYSVYFAQALDKVKIGCSRRPVDRILQVTEWVPFPVKMLATMPGTYAVEFAIHRMFAEEWSHGEWFNLTPRLQAFIDRVAKGLPVAIEARDLSEADNARRKAIADKKRLARHFNALPKPLQRKISAVPKGQAIPSELLAEAWSIIGLKPKAA